MIFAISNEKGGQAKTSTALALAEGAALRGHKVLAIDADPQGALSYELAPDADAPGLYEILTGAAQIKEATIKTRTANVFLWAGSGALAAIDRKLPGQDPMHTLRHALEPVRDIVDYIIIDCPAMVNTLQLNAMIAADSIIIPATPDAYSMRSIKHTMDTMETARQAGNPELQLAGILFTRCRKNLNAQASIIEAARAALGDKIFKATIRERANVQTAALLHTSIWAGSATKDTAEDYAALLDELKIKSTKKNKK